MLKVFVGVVHFPQARDFVVMVDGEPGPVADAVQQVIAEVWGEGEISVLAEGVDFIELRHARSTAGDDPDGYVLGIEVTSAKRLHYAIEFARRRRHLTL